MTGEVPGNGNRSYHEDGTLPSSSESAFTAKALLTGCVCAFTVSAGAAYGTMYIQGSFMALGTSLPGAVVLLFFLAGLINPILKTIHPKAGLNRRELLLVFVMMSMASPLPTLFAGRLLSIVSAPYYYATPENDWATLIRPHIPEWLMPDDPRFHSFYQGSAPGQAIPWDAWMPVFAVWSPFIWALFLVMISAMVILRKQWVENERLIYPLVQVPLAITEDGENGGRLGRLFSNPIMWLGFVVPAAWGTLHGLHTYFPHIVTMAEKQDILQIWELPVFRNTAYLNVLFRFNIIGFFYFLKTEIAFSLWFFNLLLTALTGVFGILGILSSEPLGGQDTSNPILAHQALGGMLVLFLGGLWAARRHLRAVFRKAFLGDAEVDDSGEILSYRAAVFLLIGGSGVLTGFLWLAGIPIWVALGLLFLAATLIVGYTRIVAEGGLSDGSPPVVPFPMLVSALGTSAIGEPGLVILGTTYFWTSARSFVMTSCANNLRLGEEFGRRRRPLFWVMILALAISLSASTVTVMLLCYEHGALNLRIIYTEWDRGGLEHAANLVRVQRDPHLWGWINTGIGASVMSLLMLARWRYSWWPLHPLGYPIGAIFVMNHLWFCMFVAWLIKVIVLRMGGVNLYLRTRPFFIGMLLGQIVVGGVFLVIDHFTGMTGNVIFWG